MKSFFLCSWIMLIMIFQTYPNAQNRLTKTDSSITVIFPAGTVQVQVCTEKIIRIIHSPSESFKLDSSLVITRDWDKIPFETSEKNNGYLITTKQLRIFVNQSGAVSITDAGNKLFFKEHETIPFTFTPAELPMEKTYSGQLNIMFDKTEAVYGLGQHQEGNMNYRGDEVSLVQENTQVAIPFLLSTKKYALMFDNYSKIKFMDKQDNAEIWFEAADLIDYYYISGDDMDDVIRGYRDATGQAPMPGKWAYGYWQSKERYKTQEEVLSVAEEFRRRNIPVDNIVQDWMYWGEDWANWNAMKFNSVSHPDPAGMIKSLHDKYNMKIMVSIWPVPGQNTELYKVLDSQGLLFKPYHWTDGRTYDAYSSEARKIYWDFVNRGLFSLGVDAFWMDASEPEVFLAPNERSTKSVINHSLGSIFKYFNTYSLLHTKGLYEGQRSVTSDKRICIVTRSAFLGQQRNAAVTWSGDIVADWDVYKNQIAAGLNFCMSGIPYWSNDIGGFHVKRYGAFPSGKDDPGYKELYVRWFQYGAFNPIFRSHGTDTPREPWQFGEPGSWVYDAIIKYDKLRYRLLPYIYSLAWNVTSKGYTLMRGLAMDFPDDENVYNINDQYMFGPAFLVSPVTRHMYYGESYKNEIIPSERLRTAYGKPGGFTAQYFNGVNFDTLMVDSVQSELLFDMYLGKDMPPIVNWERNSIRWTGSFLTRSEGEYEFWLTTDDAIRFYINENKLVDQWNSERKDTTYRIKLKLDSEKWYSFKVEYARMANASKFRLAWRTPEMITKKYDPSTESGSRRLYLPEGEWYDFWTGEKHSGPATITREVPIDIMPLYVRAGSIIPMGPVIQYTSEKKDPIELRIYTGRDAEFTIYDDEGNNYNYETGAFTEIPITWNETSQTLVIGTRKGEFPGMPQSLRFNIVWVNENNGTRIDESAPPHRAITYSGKLIEIKK